MINCEGCENWYHGACIGITPVRGNLIDLYYCKACEDAGKGMTTYRGFGQSSAAMVPSPVTTPHLMSALPKDSV